MPQDHRLAAIMFTDIVGYTSLMGRDEEQALKILVDNRNLHARLIGHYAGTLIKEMGDGILASFSNNADAVRCAVEIQNAAKKAGIILRIGIHEGDTVFIDEDVFGDGVNVASRLQKLTKPGEIYISGSVYKDIQNKSDISAVYVKETRLKNVNTPVAIYQVNVEVDSNKPKAARTGKPLKPRVLLFVGTAIIFLVLIWLFRATLFISPESQEARPSLQPKNSIAVLPFKNLSNDADQEYFCIGQVEAILYQLSKVKDLRVIPMTSSVRYTETKLSLREIANELHVSTILEGSVLKAEENVRITVRLVDTQTDTQIWSEKFEGTISDIFSIHDSVALKVVKGLEVKMSKKEQESIQNRPQTNNSLAYEYYLRGNHYWSQLELESAIDMYSNAIIEDSVFVAAYARRALMHMHYIWLKRLDWPEHNSPALADLGMAKSLNPVAIETRFAEAIFYYMIERKYEQSISILNQLLEIAPNNPNLYAYISYNLRRQGNWQASKAELKKAIDLDPFNANFITNLCNSLYRLHDYDSCITIAIQGKKLIPEFEIFHNWVFDSELSRSGDHDQAYKEATKIMPNLDAESFFAYERAYYTKQYDKLIEEFLAEPRSHSLQSQYWPREYDLAKIYYLDNNQSQSSKYANAAISILKDRIQLTPTDERLYGSLGKCYALAGNSDLALANWEEAINILPLENDFYLRSIRGEELMEIYIFLGEYDLAMDKIEHLLSTPSRIGVGNLIADPLYDALRSLPRFKTLVQKYQES